MRFYRFVWSSILGGKCDKISGYINPVQLNLKATTHTRVMFVPFYFRFSTNERKTCHLLSPLVSTSIIYDKQKLTCARPVTLVEKSRHSRSPLLLVIGVLRVFLVPVDVCLPETQGECGVVSFDEDALDLNDEFHVHLLLHDL